MVKTRLANDLGIERALEAHIQLSNNVASNLLQVSQCDYLLCLDRVAEVSGEDWGIFEKSLRGRLPHTLQQGEQLGDRMAAAFRDALVNYTRAVIVGSDCPAVSTQYVEQAFELLETKDLVLGPAEDGGYVLVGLRRFVPEIFKGIRWGGETVLRDTLERAAKANCSVACLDECWDVDTIEDYRRWRSQF